MGIILEADRWTPSKRRRLTDHRNPGLEIVHVVAGRTRWRIGRREFDLTPGDIYYTLPWEVHGSASPRERGLVIDFAILQLKRNYARPRNVFEFHPALGWSVGESRKLSRALTQCESRAMPAGPRLPWLLGQLVDLGPGGAKASAVLAGSLVGATLAELARLATSAPPRRDHDHAPTDSAAQRVASFLEALPKTCERPWTLGAMAEACGVGRTRFGQLVRQQTGDTPILALNRARIARAEQRLRETHQSVTRIAHDCGFSSSQYFARMFREYVGESASAFRRRH
jgi:AraC family L-rhamnose operon regulatory protein RhaS